VYHVERSGRFAIQEHAEAGGVHWDLMLEAEGCLETFRLSVAPSEMAAGPASAVRIFDHPVRFLTYEGAVNDGKGSVRIVERGTYNCASPRPGDRRLSIEGQQLKAVFSLVRVEGDRWRLEAE
jgi:hypothetical protein